MKSFSALYFWIWIPLIWGCQSDKALSPESDVSNDQKLVTYCNPLDISYRFSVEKPERREAADPTVVWFKDRYYLFASKSGGYWQSENLLDWNFIKTDQIPTEEYAPTAIAIQDTLYFLASSTEKSTIYGSADPLSGKWTVAREELETPVWDPAFFLDDDNRLYLYWGCSNEKPIYGVELDYASNFSFVEEPKTLKQANPAKFGWEVSGDFNTLVDQAPWIEGAWVNKHNGKYYLQYSGPGTEYKSYSDGVYVADSPLGPYKAQQHNPFAYKPEGFTSGAGHGSTFADRYGNLWHMGTITISQKHIFERRLGLFPAFIDENGTLYCDTSYGDFPIILPEKKIESFDEVFPGWMLLSLHKTTTVSSSIDSLGAQNITDEDIRTYWAAETGGEGEYAMVDLEEVCKIRALQINFAEHDIDYERLRKTPVHRFIVEFSKDKENWEPLIDYSANTSSQTHNYFQLEESLDARYLRITNLEIPTGNFALSGFRVFGNGSGPLPAKPMNLEITRNAQDKRKVALTWEKTENALGYNIKYGSRPDQLYQNYQVYQDTAVTINSLHTDQDYYFSIEAFNARGRTRSDVTLSSD